jgi:hypothetical protein
LPFTATAAAAETEKEARQAKAVWCEIFLLPHVLIKKCVWVQHQTSLIKAMM